LKAGTKVGITGVNGFLGKHLCDYLSKYELRFMHNDYENNILNKDSVDQFVSESDTIVHLAGKNRGDSNLILDTNVVGTYNIASSCLRQKKSLVYAGTEYSKLDSYGISKEIAEQTICSLGDLGLRYTCLKFPKLFGPGCKPFYNSFISTVLYCHAKNKEYKHLIGNIHDVLKLMYVDTACVKIENAIFSTSQDSVHFTHFGEVFYISIGEIIDIIEDRSPYHAFANLFLQTLEWYKQNDFEQP
jgi:UDP-2-acetamido-2,6-beta-L-arabino-hexul-4-ose reductase